MIKQEEVCLDLPLHYSNVDKNSLVFYLDFMASDFILVFLSRLCGILDNILDIF